MRIPAAMTSGPIPSPGTTAIFRIIIRARIIAAHGRTPRPDTPLISARLRTALARSHSRSPPRRRTPTPEPDSFSKPIATPIPASRFISRSTSLSREAVQNVEIAEVHGAGAIPSAVLIT